MPANKYPAANWNSVIVAMPAGMPVDWFNLLLVRPVAVLVYIMYSCTADAVRGWMPRAVKLHSTTAGSSSEQHIYCCHTSSSSMCNCVHWWRARGGDGERQQHRRQQQHCQQQQHVQMRIALVACPRRRRGARARPRVAARPERARWG